MTERNRNPVRDKVLIAFHETFSQPTDNDIAEWASRYPQFAEDIREHAAIKREWADAPQSDFVEIDGTMLAQGRSRALNILHDIERATAETAPETKSMTWPQILFSSNTTIPALARDINIDRMVLAELSAGRMRLPIGKRLMDALVDALKLPCTVVQNALVVLAAAPPQLGHAKADKQITITPRSYEEIIKASTMPSERKHFWLGM